MAGNQGKIGGNPLDILADYLRMILHLDIFQFNRMLEKLRKKTGQVETMLAITGYLDMAISVGGFGNLWKGTVFRNWKKIRRKLFCI